jgi:putative ABC transport system permease protein
MKKKTAPPQLARRFFEWYCDSALVEDLIGDLDELHAVNAQQMSRWKADLKYWLRVLSLVFSYAIKKRKAGAAFHPHSQTAVNLTMIRNYFKMASRTMTKNKVYTLINVMGLTLGISACLLVYLIVNHEFSF